MPDYFPEVPMIAREVKRRVPPAVEMALRLEDAERAHLALDDAGVPRAIDGQALSLTSRVACLNGMLVSATRVLAHAQVVDVRTRRIPSPQPLSRPLYRGAKRGARGSEKTRGL